MTRKRLLRIGFYGTSGLILLLVVLDPYSRQSIFGPKFGGEPLCYWQDKIRQGNAANESLVAKLLAFLGVRSRDSDDWGQLTGPERLAVWLTLLDDSDPRVRASVARVLVDYPESREAIKGLLHLLDDGISDVQGNAASAFSLIPSAAGPALPRLRKLMDHSNEMCRVHAAAAVCKAIRPRDEKALANLRAALTSSDTNTRIAAIQALCAVGTDIPAMFADLAAAVRDNRWSRAAFAANAAGFGAIAVPVLIELLGDSDELVRNGAAVSLGEIGPDAKAAVPALLNVRDGQVQPVRRNADEALSKIAPKRARQADAAPDPAR
jgi:HEAT repeat protein